ncbi:MAG: ferritin family protein [Desulfobacterales bacterium]|nr:ferritin family protein [Desulfobacterales bacterium]
MFSSNEILDMAIKLEQNGEAVYRRAIEEVSQPELVSLLEWMADEEVKHAQWLSDLKRNLKTKGSNPFVEEMSRELFNDLLGDENFSLKDVDFSSVDKIDDLVEIFIEFEKDSILFYQVLEPFIEDPAALEHLNKVIDEENSHIQRLQTFMGREQAVTVIGE